MSEPLVSVGNLKVRFTGGERPVDAVNGVDFQLAKGEVLGVLGESGSGKSVTLRALLRILPARRSTIRGSIRVGGRDVLAMSEAELAQYRGGVTSMIFQEPMLAFDPVFTIGEQIAESVMRHQKVDSAAAKKLAIGMLERVRIPSPERRYDAYPHEMSGGMRQRAMIALALVCSPQLLLADEPTTALDATVQIQILLLLRELQRELGMSVIFVTHDMGVVAEIADRVAVMYAGRMVEIGPVGEVILRAAPSVHAGAPRIDDPRLDARPADRRDSRRAAGSLPAPARVQLRAAVQARARRLRGCGARSRSPWVRRTRSRCVLVGEAVAA